MGPQWWSVQQSLGFEGVSIFKINHHMDEPIESTRERDLLNDGLEDILIEMMYQEMLMDTLRGGKITNGDYVRAERLSGIEPNNFNSDQVKGRITHLKRIQRDIMNLIKQTGLGWDPERKALVASEEHWANALKVRSSFKHFKYEQLYTIFGYLVTIETLHQALTDLASTSDDEWMLEEEMRNCGRSVADDVWGSRTDGMDVSMQSGRPFSTSYASGSR
ncbi:hypothetical protein F2P56_015491 [Juglans regia]|uniref:Myb/SANT-like domain-containing protein n=1 Tax=Juglans regia TaxID=51240 RepID=A0A833XFX4_JUGRE|nr:hypothetical protein F2P56_015491 [Juglans regia]